MLTGERRSFGPSVYIQCSKLTRGGLHPWRAGALHRRWQLLQTHNDSRRRPNVRQGVCAGEAAQLRGGKQLHHRQEVSVFVGHFHERVIVKDGVGGQVRAMVVTTSIPHCLEFCFVVCRELADRHGLARRLSPFQESMDTKDGNWSSHSPGLTGFWMSRFQVSSQVSSRKIPSIGYLSLRTCTKRVSTSGFRTPCMLTRSWRTSGRFRCSYA